MWREERINSMKKKLFMLVMCLCVLALAGGCSKKNNTSEDKVDENTQNTEGTEDTDKTTEETGSEMIKVVKEAYEVNDYVTLGQYKGIEYSISKLEVTDADVDKAIEDELNAAAAEQEVTDRNVVQNGDIVNIDYQGLKDGVAFEGGTAQGYDLEIGSGTFIPGFEEGLIGAKVGEQVDVNVSFPEDYQQSPELAGQPVVFKVTINSIKTLVVPELTEEYVKENLGFASIAEYKKDVREGLQAENEEAMEDEKIKKVLGKVIDNAEIKSYPQTLLDYYSADFKNYYIQYASYFGMDFATFLSSSGITEEQLDQEALKYAEPMAEQELVLNAIIKAENLKLSDEEFQEGVEKLTEDYGYSTKEEFLAVAEEERVRETLLWQKAVEFILDAAIEL